MATHCDLSVVGFLLGSSDGVQVVGAGSCSATIDGAQSPDASFTANPQTSSTGSASARSFDVGQGSRGSTMERSGVGCNS